MLGAYSHSHSKTRLGSRRKISNQALWMAIELLFWTRLEMTAITNLNRLLDSFYDDRPKGRKSIQNWNLSLILHQLTKLPFEPLRKDSLKHLTFKTVFLLALSSGKQRSEIDAWLHKNIRPKLARDGPNCVAPVIIPALAPTLDRSL